MQELFPFLSGAIIGLVIANLRLPNWARIGLFVALCAVFGFLASWLTGELAVSWGFFTFDALLVWLGGLLAVGAVAAWRRFAARRR
jgi:hypothetical protein